MGRPRPTPGRWPVALPLLLPLAALAVPAAAAATKPHILMVRPRLTSLSQACRQGGGRAGAAPRYQAAVYACIVCKGAYLAAV